MLQAKMQGQKVIYLQQFVYAVFHGSRGQFKILHCMSGP